MRDGCVLGVWCKHSGLKGIKIASSWFNLFYISVFIYLLIDLLLPRKQVASKVLDKT